MKLLKIAVLSFFIGFLVYTLATQSLPILKIVVVIIGIIYFAFALYKERKGVIGVLIVFSLLNFSCEEQEEDKLKKIPTLVFAKEGTELTEEILYVRDSKGYIYTFKEEVLIGFVEKLDSLKLITEGKIK